MPLGLNIFTSLDTLDGPCNNTILNLSLRKLKVIYNKNLSFYAKGFNGY